ncbi:MAG: GAF domain-containing SpoIIE family protein phosphatase [Nakamurella sp.]
MSERLENLRAIIDTGLNVLSPDELLKEMLDRIRTVLDADTAVVLLIDESGENLLAHAAHGLEEEVRQGVRVPVGVGFAGSIAAHRSPNAIDHVGPDTVFNPLLWERGLHTMIGAPMMRDENVIGVLHVGRLREQAFNGEELELLLVAAERIAGAVTAQHLTAEVAAAELLERSLLPSRFPKVPGVELAGRYAAAAPRVIGGDWYDAFTVPTGELWLVMGDVMGHGLRSAVVMGRVRSALRAYALLGGGPAHVLELTDRKVHHFEMGRLTTALCAVSAPPYDTFEISCAGHPAPILAVPGLDAVLVEVDSNPPLGAIPDVRRTSITVDMPLGSVLTLYTDGLVERKDASIDEGMDRARQSVSCDHPEVVCRTVMSRMVGHSTPEDDIAVLVMRHTAIPNCSDNGADPERNISTPSINGGNSG